MAENEPSELLHLQNDSYLLIISFIVEFVLFSVILTVDTQSIQNATCKVFFHYWIENTLNDDTFRILSGFRCKYLWVWLQSRHQEIRYTRSIITLFELLTAAATMFTRSLQTKEMMREEKEACESGVEKIQQRVTQVWFQQPVIHTAELSPAGSLYLHLRLLHPDT